MTFTLPDATPFQNALLDWFHAIKRDLPWRLTKDPYAILVSETMLQQTQVITVIPYFERFMTLFPTTKALAEASEVDILNAWAGLGYYSRVRNLQKAAILIEANGGQFPTRHADILKLSGVGPYTAGAIGSIAFGLPVPAVDGNVFRVISRVCYLTDDIAKAKTRPLFESVVASLIPTHAAGDFNEALMELGATVCKARQPLCQSCPVQAHCTAYATQTVDDLPVKTKSTQKKRLRFVVGLIENADAEFLIFTRPNKGLLANFSEFFQHEVSDVPDADFLMEHLTALELEPLNSTPLGTLEHVFTHRVWELYAYHVKVETHQIDVPGGRWVARHELSDATLTTPHLKILERLDQ